MEYRSLSSPTIYKPSISRLRLGILMHRATKPTANPEIAPSRADIPEPSVDVRVKTEIDKKEKETKEERKKTLVEPHTLRTNLQCPPRGGFLALWGSFFFRSALASSSVCLFLFPTQAAANRRDEERLLASTRPYDYIHAACRSIRWEHRAQEPFPFFLSPSLLRPINLLSPKTPRERSLFSHFFFCVIVDWMNVRRGLAFGGTWVENRNVFQSHLLGGEERGLAGKGGG